MNRTIYQVDAFTARPFAGNPAAVCVLPAPADEAWMQRLASEMNLSETAFLHPEGDGFRLRWMTPVVEVDLCGHATLASAHILWETGTLRGGEEARFYTRSGLLTARRQDAWIEMDFPARASRAIVAPPGLADALGMRPVHVADGGGDYVVEVSTADDVRRANPDRAGLLELPVQGIIVTARTEGGPYDFVSRYFAPAIGLDEDPVTGSAHACLGPYWADRLHRREFVAYQASKRGGEVRVRVGDGRVHLGGQAVTVLRCELVAPRG